MFVIISNSALLLVVLETAVLKKICTPEVAAGAQPRQRKVGERVERKTSTIIVPSTTSVVTTEDPATRTIVLTTGGTSSPSARTVTTSTRTNKGRGGEMKHQPELVIGSSLSLKLGYVRVLRFSNVCF